LFLAFHLEGKAVLHVEHLLEHSSSKIPSHNPTTPTPLPQPNSDAQTARRSAEEPGQQRHKVMTMVKTQQVTV
jgi:hypothetical protein